MSTESGPATVAATVAPQTTTALLREEPRQTTRGSHRRGGRLLMLLIPLVAGAIAVFLYLSGGRFVETENAYLKADKVPVSASVSGAVSRVHVRENQTVGAGELLFTIDPEPYRVEVERARAHLGEVVSDFAALQASYRQKQAELALKYTNQRYRKREEVRQAELAARGFISSSRLEDAQLGSRISSQEVTTLRHDLGRIAATLGGGPDTAVDAHPAYLAAKAELDRARMNLERTSVRAPIAGIVSRPPQVGQYLNTGNIALALIGTDEVWVEANYNEVDLTHVRAGQQVRIRIDTYPEHEWLGHVESISPATAAEFSVLPAQNASGNWVKVVQRVPVRVRIESRARRRPVLGGALAADSPRPVGEPVLRAGLSAEVRIDTERRRRLFGYRSDPVATMSGASGNTAAIAAPAMAVDDSPGRRNLVALAVILATVMHTLDSTIANVALPHMQGTMSATQAQIAWVLTSYIVGSAIFMPMTGFFATRMGRKRFLITSVLVFTVASMACGASQTLEQLVAFRLLQGISGACLVPLSQSILLDTYPPHQHAAAMSMWGVGVMVGPILGPTLGGWLTEFESWRWVFYINLPFGLLATSVLLAYLHDVEPPRPRRFDLLGFGLLALGLGALQLMLDRGELLNWFDSLEVQIEAFLAASCLAMFLVHLLTTRDPFLPVALFRDRNFAVGMIVVFLVGVNLLTTLALLPPLMQSLLGYPVVDVGVLLAPRGFGTMIAMLLTARFSSRVEPRVMLLFGMSLTAISTWEMSRFGLDVSGVDFVRTGIIQGLGIGFVFPPLTTMTFATLTPQFRNDGTSLFSLLRNIGSSIGIAVAVTMLARNREVNHAILVEYATPFSLALRSIGERGFWQLDSFTGLAALDAEVARQSLFIAYLQDFRLMMWVAILGMPLILLFEGRRR